MSSNSPSFFENKPVLILCIALMLFLEVVVVSADTLSREEYQNLAAPTYLDFNQLSQKTVADFNRLSREQQGLYLLGPYLNGLNTGGILKDPEFAREYLLESKFETTQETIIGRIYFSQSRETIASDLRTFKRYLKGEGLDVVDIQAGVTLNSDGQLTGKNQKLNIQQFAKSSARNQYAIDIDSEGNIFLVPKDGTSIGKKIAFTGEITVQQTTGRLNLRSGTINGVKVDDARFLMFDKNGDIVKGTVTSYGGIHFKEPATIRTTTAPGGVRLKLNNPAIASVEQSANLFLEGGILVEDYNVIKGKLKVMAGTSLDVNSFKIIATGEMVNLQFGEKNEKSDGNFVRIAKPEGVKLGGSGFSVSFPPASLRPLEEENEDKQFIVQPARGYYQSGDDPAKGSVEERSIKTIQAIVGATVDGAYGPGTKARVKEWQDKIFSETGICLGRSTSNGCMGDGLFGEKSIVYALGDQQLDHPLQITPNGGSAEISLGRDGVNANFRGALSLRIGNKHLLFDGSSLQRELVRSTFNTQLSVPAHLAFYDSSGRKIGESLETVGTESSIGQRITETTILERITTRGGVDTREAQCARTVCALFDERTPEGTRIGFTSLSGRASSEAGVEGSAWEMSANMQDKGGVLRFHSEQELSSEQRKALEELAKRTKGRYDERIAEIAYLAVTDIETYDRKEAAILRELTEQMREEEGAILNRDLTRQLPQLQNGDVVSLYFRDSGSLALAAVKGEDGHKNTHVGLVTEVVSTSISVPSGQIDYTEILKRKLGVKTIGGLYANTYYIKTDDAQGFKVATLQEGRFFDSVGDEVNNVAEIEVRRPKVSHMIHYDESGNPFNIEYLDQLLDRPMLSLYAVTSPSEEVQDAIAETQQRTDRVVISAPEKKCETAECALLPVYERARAKGAPTEVLDGLGRAVPQTKIPQHQQQAYQAAVLAAIEMESGGVKYYANRIEDTLGSLLGEESERSVGTYTQIRPSTLVMAGQITGKDVTSIDLTTDEGSVEGTAVVMEAIFKKYIDPNKTVLTDHDLEVIATAWNLGIDAERTKKIAKGDYTGLEPVEVEGIKGAIGQRWAQVQGYRTAGYETAYPARYTDAYRTFCC